MKMYTILDGEKRLQGISSSPLGENSIELEVNPDHEVMHNPYIYRYIDGTLVRDNEQHLQEVKKEKKEEMKIVCEEKIKQGFLSSNGNYYRLNEHDQMNIMSQYVAMKSNQNIETIRHETENNGCVEHTREEWEIVYNESLKHKSNCLLHYDYLKTYIDRLKTIEDVQAVKWGTNAD